MSISANSLLSAEHVIASAKVASRGIEIEWGDGHRSFFHNIWLRDNCPCDDCMVSSGERLALAVAISPDDSPDSAGVGSDGTLEIGWAADGHRTRFEAEWLRGHCYSPSARAKRRHKPTLWDAKLADDLPAFDYTAVRSEQARLLEWAEAVRDYGAAMLHGVPTDIDELERFASLVGPMEETIVGRYYDAISLPDPGHIGNLPVTLLPHNDYAAYAHPMGVAFFHCISNEAEGGETTLVDGFYVAALLKTHHPEAFEVLTRTAVPFRVFDAHGDVRCHGRVIELDTEGELMIIRYNNQLRLPLDIPGELVEPYYEAHRRFSGLIADRVNRVQMRLAPGDLLTLHNHRVMHGRGGWDPASGARHMHIGWMNFDHLLSRIRLLQVA
jgi:gamma-butyrobetaine dioxygenase